MHFHTQSLSTLPRPHRLRFNSWHHTLVLRSENTSWTRAAMCSSSTTTFRSRQSHIVSSRFFSVVRQAAKHTLETFSTCTHDFSREQRAFLTPRVEEASLHFQSSKHRMVTSLHTFRRTSFPLLTGRYSSSRISSTRACVPQSMSVSLSLVSVAPR